MAFLNILLKAFKIAKETFIFDQWYCRVCINFFKALCGDCGVLTPAKHKLSSLKCQLTYTYCLTLLVFSYDNRLLEVVTLIKINGRVKSCRLRIERLANLRHAINEATHCKSLKLIIFRFPLALCINCE